MKLQWLMVLFSLAGGAYTSAARADLDQLWAVQTLLRADLDGLKVCEGSLGKLAPALRASLPQLLEGEIRSTVSEMTEKRTLLPYLQSENRLKLCERRCRCDFYDGAAGEQLSHRPHRPLLESAVARCAKMNAGWICDGKILNGLIREAKAAHESGSSVR